MYKLIIADDEPLIRSGLFYRFDWEKAGFHVVALLEDGSEVLKYLEKSRVDVLLTDIKMYEISGLETARVISQKYPWMKVVLLSGYCEFEYAKQAIHSRVYEYLTKPIDYDNLGKVFSNIKTELDEKEKESKLLSSMGEEEYSKILDLLHMVNTTVLDKVQDNWIIYARLKPIMSTLPAEIKTVVIKRILYDLRKALWEKDTVIAKKIDTYVSNLETNNMDMNESQISQILSDINDELLAHNIKITDNKEQNEYFKKAVQYIDNHLGDDFTYRDVADFIHVSPRHFIRIFHKQTGITFTDYIIKRRIEGAMKLMDENLVNISDIGRAVGYHDERYFQQIFKKNVGCSVKDYSLKNKCKQSK